ncbi:MAG: hypothetical protein AB7G13_06195 [Lautropia sp.]
MSFPDSRISIDSNRIVEALGWTIVALSLAHLLLQSVKHLAGYGGVYGLVDLFDMGLEANLPTFFSGLQLLIGALGLAVVARVRLAERAPYALHWTALALLFLYLAADELSGLHELTIRPMRELFPSVTTGLLWWAWVIPGALFAVGLAAAFAGFALRALPRPVRTRMIAGGVLFFSGAIGVEMPEARHAQQFGTDNMTYAVYVLVEEFLEMTGVLLFLAGLFDYLRTSVGAVVVDVKHPVPVARARCRRLAA